MTSTPRTTRSRTRVIRRVKNHSTSLSDSGSVVENNVLPTDEDQWEDVSDDNIDQDYDIQVELGSPNNSTPRRGPGTPRRRKIINPHATTRKPLAVNAYTESASPPRISSKQVRYIERAQPDGGGHTPRASSREPFVSFETVVDNTVQASSFTTRYIFDVVRMALVLLRKPLGFVLFLWLLAMILLTISETLRAAVKPFCWLPGLSSTLMCRPLAPPANYTGLMQAQTRTFEQLLDETVGGSALSLEVKKAEMATSDLTTLVRISDLKSKDLLAALLTDFMQDAKKTARRLQRLHAKVGGSVDVIMTVNDHALKTIEEANKKHPVFSFNGLIPWKKARTDRLVASTFHEAMDTLTRQVSHLIIEAEANLANLNDLDERLYAINEAVSLDTKHVKMDRDELLANIWTILGGNGKEVRRYDENLALLKNVGKYRNQARVHVTAVLQSLQSLSEDMEVLRERVATPGLVGERIPLGVQIKSIQLGLERLQENRIRSRRMEEKALGHITGSAYLDAPAT